MKKISPTDERKVRSCENCKFSNIEYGDHGCDDMRCTGFKNMSYVSWEQYHRSSNCIRNLTDEEFDIIMSDLT